MEGENLWKSLTRVKIGIIDPGMQSLLPFGCPLQYCPIASPRGRMGRCKCSPPPKDKDNLIPTKKFNTRSKHELNFQVPYAKKNLYEYSFFPRTLKDWNALPSDTVNAPSLECFKDKLTNSCFVI